MSEQVAYRIERAKETYQDAVLLLEKGSLNSCINRLYYSVFLCIYRLTFNLKN
jgi:uncharacterized protein (UPF0332 family)